MTKARMSNVRWFLILWLFVLSAVSYLDRVNISIASGSIAEAYQLSDVQLGKVFSAMLVGYALFFRPVGGRFADRYGPRRVLAGGVVWWGIFTALTTLVPAKAGALLLLIAVRFLLGAGEAVIYPSANQFIARWIPAAERGLANGWIFAGVGAGAGLTPLLITGIMVRYGWRSSFWVCSAVGLAAGVVWFLSARDTPAEHPGGVRFRVIGADSLGADASATEPQSESARVLEKRSPKQGSLGAHPKLFLLRLRSLDLLQLVLSLSCKGSWPGFESKRLLHHVAVSGHVSVLSFGAERINDRLTKWRGPRIGRCGPRGIRDRRCGHIHRFGLTSSKRAARLASVVLAGGAGALYLSQSSFWSVTADLGGASSGSVSGFMNMGAQVGAALTATLTPWIARPIRLDDVIFAGRGCVKCLLGRCCKLVARRSIASTQGSAARCCGVAD